MKELDLFDAMTDIDDVYVLEAHESAAHRSPARFGGFRRAAVLIAAVMMMVATVMAGRGSNALRPSGWVMGNSTTRFDSDGTTEFVRDEGIYAVDEREIPAISYTRADTQQIETKTTCEGEQIQIILEAMILMEDDHCEYKAMTDEGRDEITVVMDNNVDGETGTIMNVRNTVSVLGEDGWTLLQTWNAFLPTQIGFEYPSGIDFRFPDMQYNYDGRGSASD